MFPNAHSASSCCLNLCGPGFNFMALVLIATLHSGCSQSEEHQAECLFTSLKKRWKRINSGQRSCTLLCYQKITFSDIELGTKSKQKTEEHKQPEFIFTQQKLNQKKKTKSVIKHLKSGYCLWKENYFAANFTNGIVGLFFDKCKNMKNKKSFFQIHPCLHLFILQTGLLLPLHAALIR